jgi:hypothetical protein
MTMMKRFLSKHLIALSLVAFGLLGLTGTAFVSAATAAAAPAASCGNDLGCVQKAGDVLIDARIAALDKLNDTAAGHKNLTSDQKAVIANDVAANENGAANLQGLKPLKTQLDGEKTVAAARTDVKNIYVQYRIYAVVLPRDYGEIELFLEQNMTTRMKNADETLSDLIAKAQAKGDDVTKLNSLKSDYDAKLADATTNENNAQGLIPSLVPANYPGTDATLKTYRSDLKTARQDLQAAESDFDQMHTILKQDLGSGS